MRAPCAGSQGGRNPWTPRGVSGWGPAAHLVGRRRSGTRATDPPSTGGADRWSVWWPEHGAGEGWPADAVPLKKTTCAPGSFCTYIAVEKPLPCILPHDILISLSRFLIPLYRKQLFTTLTLPWVLLPTSPLVRGTSWRQCLRKNAWTWRSAGTPGTDESYPVLLQLCFGFCMRNNYRKFEVDTITFDRGISKVQQITTIWESETIYQ